MHQNFSCMEVNDQEQHFVYVLYSTQSNKIYIGCTRDIENRMVWHNVKATKGFTKNFRPWIIVYQETQPSKSEALLREKALKSSRGRN